MDTLRTKLLVAETKFKAEAIIRELGLDPAVWEAMAIGTGLSARTFTDIIAHLGATKPFESAALRAEASEYRLRLGMRLAPGGRLAVL